MPNKQKIIIFIAVIVFAALGVGFYFMKTFFISQKTSEKAPSPGLVYNLVGVITEKGDNWLMVEDKTTLKSAVDANVKAAKKPLKVIVNSETKIIKGYKAEVFNNIKVGDYIFLKISETSGNINEAAAYNIDIVP